MLCWTGIISEITWRETARRQSWSSEQPTELHYKFEKNCRLECQTTVFTCVPAENLLLNASAWVREWVECIGFPLRYERNEWLHREKQSVWNFFITWQFHWLSLLWSADSAMSNNGLTNGSAHYRLGLESSSGQELPSVNMRSIMWIKEK